MNKLEVKGLKVKLPLREKSILVFIENNIGTKSGNIAKKTNIPNPTVKRILTKLVNDDLIEKYGIGAATNYGIKYNNTTLEIRAGCHLARLLDIILVL